MKTIISLVLSCFALLATVQASEIRAGVISLKQISSLTVEATTNLVVPSHVSITDLEICWGDGVCTEAVQTLEEVNAFQGLKYYTYTNLHTYPSLGMYITSISHCCYDLAINNIETELDAEFYIETMILLGTELNSGPAYNPNLTLVDADTSYAVFSVIGAVDDPEGDTYSNELCLPANLLNYTSMGWADLIISPSGGGVLVWSGPWIPGTYITQICTEERRNGTLISSTQRIVCFMIGEEFEMEVSAKEISNSEIAIFPNPVNDLLYVSNQHSNHLSISEIAIVDLQGKTKLVDYQNKEGNAVLDVSGFSHGVYYVIVMLENGEKYYKQVCINGTLFK